MSKGHYVEVYAKQADRSWKVLEDIATNGPTASANPAQ